VVIVLLDVASLPAIMAVTLLAGLAHAVENPTRRSFMREIVGPELIHNAVGLNSTIMSTARVVGPSVGGLLIAQFGYAAPFLVNGVTYVVMVIALAAMDTTTIAATQPLARRRGQLREGFRYAWSTLELRTPLAMTAIIATLAYNFTVLIPLLGRDTLDSSVTTVSFLFAAASIGTLAGSIRVAAARSVTERTAVVAALAFGVTLMTVAAAPTVQVAAVTLVVMGFASSGFMVSSNALVQSAAAEHMQGRVAAIYTAVFLGSYALGAPVVGAVAEYMSPRGSFVLGGTASILAGVLGFHWSGRTARRARMAE